MNSWLVLTMLYIYQAVVIWPMITNLWYIGSIFWSTTKMIDSPTRISLKCAHLDLDLFYLWPIDDNWVKNNPMVGLILSSFWLENKCIALFISDIMCYWAITLTRTQPWKGFWCLPVWQLLQIKHFFIFDIEDAAFHTQFLGDKWVCKIEMSV